MRSSLPILLGVLFILQLARLQNIPQLYSGEGAYSYKANYSAYVELPVELSRTLTDDFTVECWFQITQSDTRYLPNPYGPGGLNNFGSATPNFTALNRPIVGRYNSSILHPNNNLNDFLIQVNPEGYLLFFMGGSYDLGFLMITDEILDDNRWYHVAVSISFPFAYMYVDDWGTGVTRQIRDQQTTWKDVNIYPRINLRDYPFHIGHYRNDDPNWPGGQFFVGKIDEVRFWNGSRTRADIFDPLTDYENRTVNPRGFQGQEDWISNLVASYNFNDGVGNIVTDHGPHAYHGTWNAGPYNESPDWAISDVYIITYVYALANTPVDVNLYGFDKAGGEFKYVVQYDNSFDIDGQLFQRVPGTPSFLGAVPVPPYNPNGRLNSGDVATFTANDGNEATIVYISNPGVNGLRRFWYKIESQDNVLFTSRPTEVRIIVTCCCEAGDVVDYCGICNGFNSTLDQCGVCGGANACVGCDGVLDSGKKVDQCGVCGGTNDCLGCDNVPNSGLVYDACGICGGSATDPSDCPCNGPLCPPPNCTAPYCFVLGCDQVLGSGLVFDICGVCGGDNTTCVGCDGLGGGVLDACGKCNGNNDTCGGCDGLGGQVDACGECGGDNSTCTCTTYHGFHITEMDYLLLLYDIDYLLYELNVTLDIVGELLCKTYKADNNFDLGGFVKLVNSFNEGCLDPFVSAVTLLSEQVSAISGDVFTAESKKRSLPSSIDEYEWS